LEAYGDHYASITIEPPAWSRRDDDVLTAHLTYAEHVMAAVRAAVNFADPDAATNAASAAAAATRLNPHPPFAAAAAPPAPPPPPSTITSADAATTQ
jgi:hypothetical protein